jgi:hypothetical protein
MPGVKVQGLNERWPFPPTKSWCVSIVCGGKGRRGRRTAKVHFFHEVADFLGAFNMRNYDTGASCVERRGETEFVALGHAADDHCFAL